MLKVMTAAEAIDLIKDGDLIGVNAFLALNNPEALHDALYEKFMSTGHPKNLSMYCTSGFGCWNENRAGDQYIKAGAVKTLILGHIASMPAAMKAIADNKVEAYNLPLGVMAHLQRASASRKSGIFSDIGMNLFVDPRVEGPALNEISKDKWVEVINVDGKDTLYYRCPKFDIAFIRGTAADPNGNISFEKECLTVDALTLAQATRANGGKVIVQVEKLTDVFKRPRNVVIPGILVDAIVLAPDQKQVPDSTYNPSLSGDIHVDPQDMDTWVKHLKLSGNRNEKTLNISHAIIGARAAKELKEDYIVNIGIGIPENVCPAASKSGLLSKITMTVEAGGIGGLPAPGIAFGATIGADAIFDISQQFDFYNSGGLNICFMGGLEVDKYGNVNSHKLGDKVTGIGGFANITQSTKNVVFCVNFTSGGLVAHVDDDDNVIIDKEGKHKKFVDKVNGISFSAKNAVASKQNVLYVTERCVFRLTEKGLMLTEVAKGIDIQRDILDMLDFDIEISDNIIEMDFSNNVIRD